MQPAETTPRAIPFVAVLAWTLAAVFLATGLGKALDVAGFAAVLGTYRLLPDAMLLPAAVAIVAIELAIVTGLARPRWRRGAAFWASIVAAGNTMVLIITLMRGIALENCGCFGVFLARPLSWATPVEDVVLLALAATVARRA